MGLVDTNIILRWLLDDHPTLSKAAEKLVHNAKPGSLLITEIVVAEIVYVLRGTGRDIAQVSEALLLLDRTTAFKYENRELILTIIGLLISLRLDFADCYLLARARNEKVGLETFDIPLNNAYTNQSTSLVQSAGSKSH